MRNVLFKIAKRLRRWWNLCLSSLTPECIANIQHPVLLEGRVRRIVGNNNTFGYFPSPICFSGYINSDFHPIHIAKRHNGNAKSKDVIIGNNVFIGNNVSICKGVYIGDNAVIANGAVVFDDVKENTIVRGNPPVLYKEIYE